MLKKIPFRIIWRNKSHFFGIIALVLLASFAYTTFSFLIVNVKQNYENFAERGNQEDFNFLTARPIEISEVEKKYGLQVEEKLLWDYSFDNKTIRFFNIAQRVNKPFVSEGKLPGPGEICLDINFAQKNDLEIRDELEIKGKRFKISGYVYLPDYVYILKTDQDILNDPEHFGVGVMSLSDLKSFMPKSSYHYYMAKGELEDLDAFKEELNTNYTLMKFQEKEENLRIVTTDLKMKAAEPVSIVLASIILIISSVLLFIVLKRLIDSMHAEIGTLYALGYNQKEITLSYLGFPLFIWLTGSIPGCILGYFAADPYIKFYASYFSIPLTEKIISYKDLALGGLLPAAFMFLAALFALWGLLKQSVVEIIRGEAEKAFGKKYRLAFLDRLPFRRKLTLKQGLLHPSRELVLIVGIAFSTFLLLYGITAQSAFSNLVEEAYKEAFRYEYMYLLNTYQTENKYPEAERFNVMRFTIEGEEAKISIFGIEKNSDLVILKDEKGEKLPLDGLVITKSLADKFSKKEGDTLELVSETTGEKYSLKVRAVADLYIGNSGYINLEEFNETFDFPADTFLGLFSPRELPIPKEQVLSEMDKGYLIKSFEDSMASVKQLIQVMGFVSFLIALAIVYVLSSLTISENRKPIALFKILGYRNNELSSIFLGFNNISFILGFLLGIPIFNYFVQAFYMQLIKDLDFSIRMEVSLQGVLIAFIVLGLVFVLTKYLSKRKIFKIPPAVILKEQME